MLTFHSHFPYILFPLTFPQIPDDLKKRKTSLLATKTVIGLAPDKWYIHVINPTCPLDGIILHQIIIGLGNAQSKNGGRLDCAAKKQNGGRIRFPIPPSLCCCLSSDFLGEGLGHFR